MKQDSLSRFNFSFHSFQYFQYYDLFQYDKFWIQILQFISSRNFVSLYAGVKVLFHMIVHIYCFLNLKFISIFSSFAELTATSGQELLLLVHENLNFLIMHTWRINGWVLIIFYMWFLQKMFLIFSTFPYALMFRQSQRFSFYLLLFFDQ